MRCRLTGQALREVAIAAGLPPSARPPLAPRGGEAVASGAAAGGKQEAPQRTAWLREQLGARLALPCVSGEMHLVGGEIEAGAGAAPGGGGGGGGGVAASFGGGRLRAPQRAAVLRKVLALLGPGPVLLLCEAPLAVLQACASCTRLAVPTPCTHTTPAGQRGRESAALCV